MSVEKISAPPDVHPGDTYSNQPPPPQPYLGYPPLPGAPGTIAYDPTKQPMGVGAAQSGPMPTGNGAPPYYPNPNSQPPPGKGASPYYPNPNSQPPPGNGASPYYTNPNSQPPPGNGASPYYPNPNSQPPPGKGASPYYPNPNSQPPPGYGAPPYYPNSQPPPGAWPPQPISQQQTSSNVVVVNSQPSAMSSTVYVTSNDQSSFIFGVVVSVVAVFCLCWWSLVCTIPGAVVGHMAAAAGRNGDKVTKKKYDQISGVLIVAGIIFQVIGPIIIIGSSVASVARLSSSIPSSYYYYNSG